MVIDSITFRNFNEVIINGVFRNGSLQEETDVAITFYGEDVMKALDNMSIYLHISDISLFELFYMKQYTYLTKIHSMNFINDRAYLGIKGEFPDIDVYMQRLDSLYDNDSSLGNILYPIIYTRAEIDVELKGAQVFSATGIIDATFVNILRKKYITEDGQLNIRALKEEFVGTFANNFFQYMHRELTNVDSTYLSLMENLYWNKISYAKDKPIFDIYKFYTALGELQFIDSPVTIPNLREYVEYLYSDESQNQHIQILCSMSLFSALYLSIFFDLFFTRRGIHIDVKIQDIRAVRSRKGEDRTMDITTDTNYTTLCNNIQKEEAGITELMEKHEDNERSLLRQVQLLPGTIQIKCMFDFHMGEFQWESYQYFQAFIDRANCKTLSREVKDLFDHLKRYDTTIKQMQS